MRSQARSASHRLFALFDRTFVAAAPAVAVLVALWTITLVAWGDYAAYTTQQVDYLWQSLGRAALGDDPVASLLAMHIQPPGLNSWYAVDLWLTPDRHLVLLLSFLALAVGTAVLIADTLRRVNVPGVLAALAALGYALLPSTVGYALWPYVVTPVAFFALAAVWGVALARQRLRLGVGLSALAVLGLVVVRPSFAWFILLLWCGGLTLYVIRRHPRPLLATALLVIWLPAAAGVAIQAHYWVSFGLPTMTSWSGENVAKALWTSRQLVVTPEARQRAAADPCLAAMLTAYQEDRLNRWDDAAFRGLPECAAIPPLPARGTAAWDSPVKAESGEPNMNYGDRLVASREWTELMQIVVREHPQQLLAMAVRNDDGFWKSGLGLYLSPSEDYPFIFPATDHLPTATWMLRWSWTVAVAGWVLLIAGWLQAVFARSSILRSMPAFWFASALLTYHLVTNVLLEYSENMRYRAEVEPLLMTVGAMSLYAFWRLFAARRARRREACS